MIDYILAAEFDDLKGKVIRFSYPTSLNSLEKGEPESPPKKGSKIQTPMGSIEDRVAEMIIPDTGNDRMIDSLFFMVNRPKLRTVASNMHSLVRSKNTILAKILTP